MKRLLVLAVCCVFLFGNASAWALENYRRSVNAPALDGGTDWLNTAGPLKLRDLEGKFVILDFWTYCCINCMHILPELHKLEKAWPNNLVVIGVHSAKFFTERDTENIREAIVRYKIEHPVINDPQLALWRKFEVDTWPSLRIIDPQGKLIAWHRGEIEFETLNRFMERNVASYRRKGVLDETPLHFELEENRLAPTPLRFPGKVLADEASNRLYIADSWHNRIVITDLEGKLRGAIGSGAIGSKDGIARDATFDHPQGMCLHDGMLYIADTENHLIRRVDMKTGMVRTVAGTGKQARTAVVRSVTRPTGRPLASPWDVYAHDDQLYIAMAGSHQIWRMTLDDRRLLSPYAGNGAEDIRDGPLLPRSPGQTGFSSFAQPSGLTSDGQWLFVADSEGSSIRAVPFDGRSEVKTVMGTSQRPDARLFTFGDEDGPFGQAMLQHPVCVEWYRDKLYVADTYNNKIRELDLKRGTCVTIVGDGKAGSTDDPPQFDEPTGVSAANGKLFVADTNNHQIRVIDIENDYRVSTLKIPGLTPPKPLNADPFPVAENVDRQTFADTKLRADDMKLNVKLALSLPTGFKMNERAPMRYLLQVANDERLFDPAAVSKPHRVTEPAKEMTIALPLAAAQGTDRLRITLTYYYCRSGSEGICKRGSVSWTGRVSIAASNPAGPLTLSHKVDSP